MASKVGEVFRHNIQVYIRQFNVKISEIYLEIQKRLMKQTQHNPRGGSKRKSNSRFDWTKMRMK
jgi:hypothetical protein